MNGIYTGRLACDGNGNLLADESEKIGDKTVFLTDESGETITGPDGLALSVVIPIFRYGPNHGLPVAYHDGSYVFVQPGEQSHNERHHQNAVDMFGTQDTDPDAPGYAGTKEEPVAGAEHHFGVTEDDAHYDPDSPTGVKTKFDPDRIAATVTSHTEAYKNG